MTHRASRHTLATLALVFAAAAMTATGAVEPHAGMLRYPDVSSTHIAFLYANDLWIVPREGGVATRVFTELAGRFREFVDLLTEVSERTMVNTPA